MLIYFLPVMVVLGIITSYEDIKEGKIRNFHILTAVLIGLSLHATLVLLGDMTTYQALTSLFYTIIALVIGVVIWLLRLWSAGDAKLFTAFTAIIPSTAYGASATQFPPFDMLVNIILPIFLYLLFVMLIKTSVKQKLSVIKESWNIKRLSYTLLLIFSLSWIIRQVFLWLNIQQNYFFYIIIIAAMDRVIRLLFQEQATALLIMISLSRVVLNYKFILSYQFLISFLVITAIYILAMNFIGNLSQFFTKKVFIHELKPGMILLEAITKNGHRMYPGTLHKDKLMIVPNMGGLSEEDVNNLRTRHLMGKIHFNELLVKQTIPFAPFIFVGVLITVISKGNLALLIRLLI